MNHEKLKTAALYEAIQANVAIQKRNPPDSPEATAARENNRPLLAEMARREAAGEPVPVVL